MDIEKWVLGDKRIQELGHFLDMTGGKVIEEHKVFLRAQIQHLIEKGWKNPEEIGLLQTK